MSKAAVVEGVKVEAVEVEAVEVEGAEVVLTRAEVVLVAKAEVDVPCVAFPLGVVAFAFGVVVGIEVVVVGAVVLSAGEVVVGLISLRRRSAFCTKDREILGSYEITLMHNGSMSNIPAITLESMSSPTIAEIRSFFSTTATGLETFGEAQASILGIVGRVKA